MKTVWVFGASRSIGKAVADRMHARGDNVLGFSRSGPNHLDFADVETTRKRIGLCVSDDPPDAAVFCQRYRAPVNEEILPSIRNAVDVELGPAVVLSSMCPSVRMVMLTSVAGERPVDTQGPGYHVIKAAQIALMRYFASRGLDAHYIALGDFCKDPLDAGVIDRITALL